MAQFKLNPLTGLLDLVGTGGAGAGTDHHSGWENILSSETVTIAARKQMVVYGEFILDGILNIDGSLILED